MNNLLPQTYLFALIGLLTVVAILVGRQLLRVRKDEIELTKLEKGNIASSKIAADLYELASVQLRKRLYPQATTTLKKALKQLENEPDEAKALIANALGFSLAAQDEFKEAISHYKAALKAKSDYPVALNNLAFAKQKISQEDEATKLYEKVLEIDPKNKTAKRQLKALANKTLISSENASVDKGF